MFVYNEESSYLAHVMVYDYTKSKDTFYAAIHRHPALKNDPAFWLKIVDCNFGSDHMDNLLETYAGPQVFVDRAFMLKVCSYAASTARFIGDELLQQEGFVKDVLAFPNRKLVLPHIPFRYQTCEAVTQVLCKVNYDCCSCQKLKDFIAPELWKDEAFLRSWYEAGGWFVDGVPEFDAERDNWDSYLLIAEHCDAVRDAEDVFNAGPSEMKNDKSFMTKAISRNARIYFTAHESLRNDFEFMVTAFAASKDDRGFKSSMAARFFATHIHNWAYVMGLRRDIEMKLHNGNLFFSTVLPAMAVKGSTLNTINFEPGLKKLVAEHIGVPLRKEQTPILQKALQIFPQSEEELVAHYKYVPTGLYSNPFQ